MADLILNLLFFGGGMVFGMLLYADAIEDPDDQAIIGPLRASAVSCSFQSTSFASRPCRSISMARGIDRGDRSCQVAGMNF
jgi:hypothetical protein